jgi:hypothetical protein
MIAFVGPSSLTVSARDTVVLVSKMGSILGIELGIKLGTELESKPGSILGTELGGRFPLTEAVLDSKLGTGLDIKLDFKLGTVLDRRRRTVVVLDLRLFSLGKKARALERACTPSQDGAIGPIFEGDMPPKK